MSMKVDQSIILLYKLNRFVPETILKTFYTSLIYPYLSYGIEAWHITYQTLRELPALIFRNWVHFKQIYIYMLYIIYVIYVK